MHFLSSIAETLVLTRISLALNICDSLCVTLTGPGGAAMLASLTLVRYNEKTFGTESETGNGTKLAI